jgi:hypothetical protein
MADNKIKVVESKVHGLTLSTKQGNSLFLNPGERIAAAEVSDDYVARLEEGSVRELGQANLLELTPQEWHGEAPEQEVIGPDTDPSGDDEGYEGQTVDELKALADSRGLEVEGSGAGGNAVKADYVAALEADDAK